LFERRSVRQFRAQPVPLDYLGGWLAALRRRMLGNTPKHAYASAGGCYPVQIYLHAKRNGIAGCGPGLYYYQPIEHALVPLTLGVDIDASVHEPFTNRPTFEQARFSIFLVSEPRAIEPRYGDLSGRFCLLEAGAITHLLESSASRFDLGVCQVGWLQFAAFRHLMHLDERQDLLHSLIGGLAEEVTSSHQEWQEGTI
jgi:SagB-type dehydrogenase family enzyme